MTLFWILCDQQIPQLNQPYRIISKNSSKHSFGNDVVPMFYRHYIGIVPMMHQHYNDSLLIIYLHYIHFNRHCTDSLRNYNEIVQMIHVTMTIISRVKLITLYLDMLMRQILFFHFTHFFIVYAMVLVHRQYNVVTVLADTKTTLYDIVTTLYLRYNDSIALISKKHARSKVNSPQKHI